MIAEALQYAATWLVTPAHVRPFIRYSVNLWSRARRCRSHWAEHESRSRAFIISAAQDLRQRRTAVVLGSGLLRDVPVMALAKSFDTLVLVDLVHPASVRLWLMMKGVRNVRLIHQDLSGYDAVAHGKYAEPLGFLRQVPYLDFVVSANLLSQIGTGAKRRMEAEQFHPMPQDMLHRLIRAHLDGLAGLACKTCLVTDISYRVIDRTGTEHEETDMLHGATTADPKARWDWPVVPLGEESPDYRVVHRVVAL